MEVIKPANAIQKFAGLQEWKGEHPLRFLHYLIPVPVEEGTLLYNVLTKELLLLAGDEYTCLKDNQLLQVGCFQTADKEIYQYLYENWFLVPMTHDDKKLALEVRELAALMSPQEGLSFYMIMTTTDCNARCFYCYEQGCKKESMSSQIASDTGRFIRNSRSENEIELHWYGGEPLYNPEAIDAITDDLTEHSVPFFSSMTSNAYFFNKKTVEKAVTKWNLKKIQITLDGTESEYNRRKAYINCTESAFVRVLDNMEMLLDAGVKVTVRLNMDSENVDDLIVLCDDLAERFCGYQNLGLSAAYLSGCKDRMPLRGDPKQVYSDLVRLKNHIKSLRFKKTEKKYVDLEQIKIYHCMADNDGGVIISPTGDLKNCQHYIQAGSCGSIYSGITDREVVNCWKVIFEPDQACGTCPLFPNCIRLKECFEDRRCLNYQYEEDISALKASIKNCYRRYKEK
ncbi:MAG: 4Fe-4S cluster-binding domain-containing protein [Lachnospiraceae bacterium]|nr:4Fe-4S cluster-binding domain-containing protein [Lachnospiraceae bacterium]